MIGLLSSFEIFASILTPSASVFLKYPGVGLKVNNMKIQMAINIPIIPNTSFLNMRSSLFYRNFLLMKIIY